MKLHLIAAATTLIVNACRAPNPATEVKALEDTYRIDNHGDYYVAYCRDGLVEPNASEERVLANEVCDPNFVGVDYQIHIKQVFQNPAATPGKQYLAILADDIWTSSWRHIVVFGDSDETEKLRSFPIEGYFGNNPGNTATARDNFYTINATRTESGIDLEMRGDRPGYEYNLSYIPLEDNSMDDDLVRRMSDYYKKLDRLYAERNYSLNHLKKLVALHMRAHEYGESYKSRIPFSFKKGWIQSGHRLNLSEPNPRFIDVTIDEEDAQDVISNHLGIEKYTPDRELPPIGEGIASLSIDANSLEREYYVAGDYFTGFEQRSIFEMAMYDYVEHSIIKLEPSACEGWIEWQKSYHWILKDGSILSYLADQECD